MSYSIVWMPEAVLTFQDRIAYLNFHWTDREIRNFNNRVLEYLDTLKDNPQIGFQGKIKNVHIGLIIKPVSLVYRVKMISREIELILLLIIAKILKNSKSINNLAGRI